ncbi:MAG: hypothetical protein U0359_13880 [Byssovorax sp.]
MNTKRWALGLCGIAALTGCGSSEPSPPGEDAGPSRCDAGSAQGIEVAPTDVYGGIPYALGYPPYAIDGCTLVYVARATGGGSGELRARDLATGSERVVAPAGDEPRRPAVAGDLIVWEATISGKSAIRFEASGAAGTITGSFDHASEPRAAAGAVAFTAWLGPKTTDDTDVLLFDVAAGALTPLGAGPGQQRFPDISTTHVVWSDFSEDPDATFDENDVDQADLVLYDRASGKSETRKRPGKQAFATLGAPGKIAYLDWNLVHPEPKFSAYELRIGDVGAPVETDALVEHVDTLEPYVRPVARGKLLEWVAWPNGQAGLYRRAVDLATPAVRLPGLDGISLTSPTASEAITLIGTRTGTGVTELRAFPR